MFCQIRIATDTMEVMVYGVAILYLGMNFTAFSEHFTAAEHYTLSYGTEFL